MKFNKAWDEVRAQSAEAKKKLLDNIAKVRYNIHTDLEEVLMRDHSVDMEVSKAIKETCLEFGKNIREAAAEIAPKAPAPIIAGGLVRDMVYGVPWKDMDIFFDLSAYDVEEVDDLCLLLTNQLAPTELVDLSVNGDGYPIDRSENPVGFIAGYGGWVPVENRPDNYTELQVLGRMMPKDDTIASFDYGLVQCYYDTGVEKFAFTEAFKLDCQKSELEVKSDKTYRRIKRWLNRNPVLKSKIKVNRVKSSDSSYLWDFKKYLYTCPTTAEPIRIQNVEF